jgi:hypothetical protein
MPIFFWEKCDMGNRLFVSVLVPLRAGTYSAERVPFDLCVTCISSEIFQKETRKGIISGRKYLFSVIVKNNEEEQ